MNAKNEFTKIFLIGVLFIFSFPGCLFPNKKKDVWLLIPLALTGSASPVSQPRYSLGGSLTGLEDGKYLTFKNSNSLGESEISVLKNGSYTFNAEYASGFEYDISITKQAVGQICTLENGKGIISEGNVTNINVSCATSTNPPNQPSLSVNFNDVDANPGKIGGTILIEKPSDESSITTYSLYWSNSAGVKQSSTPITTLQKSGSNLSYAIPKGTSIPSEATHILSITGNSAGEMSSGVIAIIQDYVDSTVPTTGILQSSSITSSTLILSWDKSTDNSSLQSNLKYKVYRSTANNIDTVTNAETNGTPLNEFTTDLTTYNVVGLSPNTTYYFNVITKDELGNKSVHTMISITTLNNNAPVPGNNGLVTSSGITTNSVNLSWTTGTDNLTSEGNLEYIVYRSSANNISTVANAEANGTALNAYTAGLTAYNATGLVSAATYYFTVVVKDTDGYKSIYQTAIVQTIDGNAPTPGASGTISASNVTGTTLTLNWTKANDDITTQSNLQYIVYCSATNNINTVANAEANGTPLNNYTADINNLNVSGLSSSSAYYFNLIVKDEAGNKSVYSMLNISTIDGIPPIPGNGGIITTPSIPTGSSIPLAWTKATDTISAQNTLQYIVYRSNSNNIGSVVDAEANGTAVNSYTTDINSLTDNGLLSGSTYYYNVIVKDQSGNKAVYTMTSFGTEIFSWKFVDGNQTETGINRNSALDGLRQNTVVFNSKLYACWDEGKRIRLVVYNGDDNNPSWTSVDNGTVNRLSTRDAYYCTLKVFNSKLYIAWQEVKSDNTKYQIRAAVYNGNDASPSFTFIDGNAVDIGLNKNSNHPAVVTPVFLEVHNSKLHLAWAEETSSDVHSVYVAEYNSNDSSPAWSFIDGASSRVNENQTRAFLYSFKSINSKLYLSSGGQATDWYSYIYRYNENPNLNWTNITNNLYSSLSLHYNDAIFGEYNSKLFSFISGSGNLHIKEFDGISSWAFGTNAVFDKSTSNNVGQPFVTNHNSKLYICWLELVGSIGNVRVKTFGTYNGASTSWFFVDGNGANGINKNPAKDALNPKMVSFNGKLYIIWTEQNSSSKYQIRVARGE